MTLPTGFRPRSAEEHLARARELWGADGATVHLDDPGDGWRAAGLKVAGAVPVAAPGASVGRANRNLEGLGLGPLGAGLPPAEGPLVTVLVCTYNRADLLPEALASALAQTWPVEVLVVDDGSTDHTPAVLAATRGILHVRQEPNQGKPAALNRGLAEARGEAVLVLDDDDRLLPGAVQALATALFARPEAAAVLADTIRFGDGPDPVLAVRPALRLPPARLAAAVLDQIPAWPGATLVRRSAQAAAGEYHPGLNMLEDMDMYLRLARVGPLLTLPLPAQLYRMHDGARGGAADGQRHSVDPVAFRQARVARARPVYAERWRDLAPAADRSTGHHWALGLKLRGLHAEAAAEAGRWPPPWSPAETRIRRRVGLPAPAPRVDHTVVVVGDGDPGALAECLARHATAGALVVCTALPVETAPAVDVEWAPRLLPSPGLAAALRSPGPWHLRLSSAPDWAPPPVDDPALVPLLAGPDGDRAAVWATALALGWPLPEPSRLGVPPVAHPVLPPLRAARAAADPLAGLRALLPLLQALPQWKAAWRLAADLAAQAGRAADAAAFARRGR